MNIINKLFDKKAEQINMYILIGEKGQIVQDKLKVI
jgi:hypothetical protein